MARPNPTLSDLPEELVSNVSARLWSDDVHSLRLTCKALEQKTLHEWATEYFGEKCFVISTDSLKVLVNIANSTKLRGFLHRLHILTAYFSHTAFACSRTCPHGHCCGWQPTTRQREAWNFLCLDQKTIKDSGRDKEMLVEALRKLPALRDISIVDCTAAVPMSVDIRMLRKVSRLCGRNCQFPTDGKDSPEYQKVLSHTWSILTTAIAESGITTLKRFGTNLGKGRNSLCIPSDIRFSDGKLDRLKKAFNGVDHFHLQTTARLSPHASRTQQMATLKHVPHRVKRFTAVLPNLRCLSLDFDSQPSDEPAFTIFMRHLDVSKLTKLQLNTLTIERRALMAAFDRLTSVRDLLLTFVELTKGSWIPVLKQLQGMKGHLEHLHLMYLMETGKKAYFLAPPDEDELMDEEEEDFFDDMMMHAYDDLDFDDDEGTDEDLSHAETMDGPIVGGASSSSSGGVPLTDTIVDASSSSTPEPSSVMNPSQGNASSAPAGLAPTSTSASTSNPSGLKPAPQDYHASKDHKAPGSEAFPERGYYVCLRGKEEINKQLKTFVLEYHLGERIDEFGPPPGMMGGAIPIPVPAGHPPGQPPNINNILDGLAGYLGVPPPGQNAGGVLGVGQGLGAQVAAANVNANAAGGQTGGANSTTNTSVAGTANATNMTSQATGGAAPGPVAPANTMGAGAAAAGGGLVPLGFEDVLTGGQNPTSPAGVRDAGGVMADDEWATDGESEFESD